MQKTQEALKKIEIEGISGGNAIRVIMNGDGELKKISLDENLLKESKEKGQITFSELQNIKKKELLNQEKEGEIYKKFKNIFLDGELVKVSKKD